MKVTFTNIECRDENYEIEIEELQTVKDIINSVECQKNNKLTNRSFYFVYGNIILNEDKYSQFYKICSNDEIRFGKLENFLQENDVIVELFINGHVPELIYLIMKKNDSISKIKSIINIIIPNICVMFNMNGNEIKDDQIVIDINTVSEYYKLIIGCEDLLTFEIDNSLKLHDQYLTRNYLATFGWLYWWDYKIKESNKNRWIKVINAAIKLITSNEEFNPLLIDFMSLPISFVKSKYIFCVDITNRILQICDIYWQSLLKERERNGYFMGYFQATLYVAIIDHITNNEINENMFIKNIVLIALNQLIDYLTNFLNKWQYLVRQFLKNFWYQSYSANELREMIGKRNSVVALLKKGDQEYSISVDKESKTILQVIRSISSLTGISLKNLHCIKYHGDDDNPKDDDHFNDYYHLIEVSHNMDDIMILKLLGKGSFGKVFLCENTETKVLFALKKPFRTEKNLYRELSIYNQIKECKYIEKYTSLYLNDGILCFAMKYISGGSIRSYLDKGKWFTEKEIARISLQVLNQLMELHETGIIHRDVKSENVVLDNDNNAKLIDFGISKCTRGISDEKIMENLRAYEPGTIYCMAPELLKNELYTNKIDIWSFGIMLVEMITGKQPFLHLNPIQTAIQITEIQKFEYVPLKPISTELIDFIDLCLKTDSNERPGVKQLIKTSFLLDY